MRRAVTISLSITLMLGGCQTTTSTPTGTDGTPIAQSAAPAPPGAPEGTCWDKTITPAVIESVREDVLLEPARISPEGNILKPPVYRTETRQQIVTPRKDSWFETPCPDVLTPEFISSVQRALGARGLYRGAPDGKLNRRTRRAIQAFQREDGLDSDTLSLKSARRLGLVAIPREVTEG